MADGSSQGGVVTPKQDKHLALQGDDTYISTTTRTTLDSESHAPTPYLPAHEESSAAPMASDRDPLRPAQDSVSTGHHGPQPAGRPTGGAQEWRLNNNINSQDITPSGDRCNNLISLFAPFPFFNF